MKTKIIPFDLELAKKIQAGEIKGEIKTRNGGWARILSFDSKLTFVRNEHGEILSKNGYNKPIVVEYCYNYGTPSLVSLFDDGVYNRDGESDVDLFLEVLDNEPQFKPFDKVLCRDNNDDVWKANLFSHKNEPGLIYQYYVCGGNFYKQCIPYEGNEHLVGTTDKPKED